MTWCRLGHWNRKVFETQSGYRSGKIGEQQDLSLDKRFQTVFWDIPGPDLAEQADTGSIYNYEKTHKEDQTVELRCSLKTPLNKSDRNIWTKSKKTHPFGYTGSACFPTPPPHSLERSTVQPSLRTTNFWSQTHDPPTSAS